ncbi:DUF4176 domain-containing protein [Tumebacillus permanentifrigoris]|nr:DUF4176 domain-containing protein [Tumebacillus permanentifrigoris]
MNVAIVVKADIADEDMIVLIIGKRIVNPDTNNPWDYVGVKYPMGLDRHRDFVYFNHMDIYEVVAEAPTLVDPKEEDEA